MNGTLLSFEPLEYDFIQCSNSKDNNTNYKTFAFNVILNCFIDIKENLDISKNFFMKYSLEIFYQLLMKIKWIMLKFQLK